MEVTGVSEAAQFLNVSINGIETVFKLTGNLLRFNLHVAKEMFTFLYARQKETTAEKELLASGETELQKLFSLCDKNHEQVGVMQIDDEIKGDFIHFANDNGLAYSFLFDANKNDGKAEVVYRGSQAAAFEAFIRSYHPKARVYSMNDYMNNATPEELFAAEQILSREEKDFINNKLADERENKLVGVAIDESQITGVTEQNVEVCISDEKGTKMYVEVPRDRLVFHNNTYLLTVSDSDKLCGYEASGFVKGDGNGKSAVSRLPDEKRGEPKAIKGADARKMAGIRYYEAKKERIAGNGKAERIFKNTGTNAVKTVDLAKIKAAEGMTKGVKPKAR